MNRGNVLAQSGRYLEGIACYDQALRLRRDYPSAHWNRSLSLLALGDLSAASPSMNGAGGARKPRSACFRVPWEGQTLDGKTILLWCEQGMGDMIQFSRYAYVIKQRWPTATVILECPAPMVKLLATCLGVDRCIAEGTELPAFDCHAPLMSLPFLCGTTLCTVPGDVPYLKADAAQVEVFRAGFGEQKGTSKLKIGITWQGNPRHHWDAHRSFSLQWFRSLAGLQGVELYSLQKGAGVEQLKTARFRSPI